MWEPGNADVDLYGGTRHSTVVHLGQFFTSEQPKCVSFHCTYKAFEAYNKVRLDHVKVVNEAGGSVH
ncbi:MAG TPA: hypothetical protein VEF34_11975 [Syntrophobacteraceae bacterium]|nr:hypothetical protein [Syntrophobacteraceae bacterium]